MYWFGRPIPDKYVALVSSGWGKPRPGGEHQAIDIVGEMGTPILAVADGIVVRAQRDITGPSGRYVTLFHSRGVHTRYMHLDGLRRGLKVGDRVNLGDVIGFLGNTGRSSTPHLHFDIHVPPMMLPEVAVAVGRPTTGWGDQDALGVAIPAEPWLPVDKYRDDVVRTAAALGIPLWRSIFNLPMV